MGKINLARLLTLLASLAGYWAVFQTNLSPGAKAGLGSATLAVIATYVHEHHATERANTAAAASLGQPPPTAPTLRDVKALTGDLMADLGLGKLPTGPVPNQAQQGSAPPPSSSSP